MFGARAYADNPNQEDLCRAIDFAHLHGARLYLTVNTLVKDQELERLPEFLEPFYRQGLDGVIVQDLGVWERIRREFPGLELHASTQMTLLGAPGAALLKELGAARIVPARRLGRSRRKWILRWRPLSTGRCATATRDNACSAAFWAAAAETGAGAHSPAVCLTVPMTRGRQGDAPFPARGRSTF